MPAASIEIAKPLLRAPPFPGVHAFISKSGTCDPPIRRSTDVDRIFAAIRTARVGGHFWDPPMSEVSARVVVRARDDEEFETIRVALGETVIQAAAVDPWSVLTAGIRLVAHGDDEWVALAHIAGNPVNILSKGRFGTPSASEAEIRSSVAAELLSTTYYDPFTGLETPIEAAITQLAHWRGVFEANRDIVAACGIAWWKRREIKRFLSTPNKEVRFFRSERHAIAHATARCGAIAVWPSRISPGMAKRAQAKDVSLVRIEDGFVRSVGLGSNLVPPSSITVDRLGIHYDPAHPSDLEVLLAQTTFSSSLLDRAADLRNVILASGISKYGSDDCSTVPKRQGGRRLVLVPGQVEDDMSVRFGGGGLTSNLELLRRARALEPDAEIWFRPHPDVDAGHRKGVVRDGDALNQADRIVRGGGMAALLGTVDAVHVLTSLTGFEAILRGLEVTCHGTPFYAGWGLTRDMAPVPDRRGRSLTIEELIAGVLILYPRYLDPATGLPCPPEILIRRMLDGPKHNRLSWITRIRQVQGSLRRRAA